MLVMNAYSTNILLPLCSRLPFCFAHELSMSLRNIYTPRIALNSALNNQQYAHDTLWMLFVSYHSVLNITLLIQFKNSCLNSLVLFTGMRRNSTPSNDYVYEDLFYVYSLHEKYNYGEN